MPRRPLPDRPRSSRSPEVADPDNPTDAEMLAIARWHDRNADALFERGVECYIDDEYDPT